MTRMIMDHRCQKCGGQTQPEVVQKRPMLEIWEWTCIICGRTFYQELGHQKAPPLPPREPGPAKPGFRVRN